MPGLHAQRPPRLACALLLLLLLLLLPLLLLGPLPAWAAWDASAQGVEVEVKGGLEEAAPLTEGGLGGKHTSSALPHPPCCHCRSAAAAALLPLPLPLPLPLCCLPRTSAATALPCCPLQRRLWACCASLTTALMPPSRLAGRGGPLATPQTPAAGST